VQYWLVMRNSIAQQTQVVEHLVCIFPEERRRRVYEYLPQDRAPKVIFILATKESDPESKIQLGNHSGRIERLTL
jgi:hypothetical protein